MVIDGLAWPTIARIGGAQTFEPQPIRTEPDGIIDVS
jgi:hypothetical protein